MLCHSICIADTIKLISIHFYFRKAAEREKLEGIRARMVADMRAKGVNEKYFGEVLTLDIEKILTQ